MSDDLGGFEDATLPRDPLSDPDARVWYAKTFNTRRPGREVLDSFESNVKGQDLQVRDRGSSYITIASQRLAPWGPIAAIVIGVIVLCTVLALTTVTPLFIVLLPAALIPAVPFAFSRGDLVTVATFEADDETSVSIDGRVSPTLRSSLDQLVEQLAPRSPL